MLGRHVPLRAKVRRVDAVFFVGNCRFCGKPIRKRHGGAWRHDKDPDRRDDRAPRE
jgi:hypothetical protein